VGRVNISLKRIIEALLFAADESISVSRLRNIIENAQVRDIRSAIEELNEEYESSGRAFMIEEIADGYRMYTRPEFNDWLKKLFKQRTEGRLSLASLETLAIVAYKQPIERAEIEDIRGVDVGQILRNLLDKDLIKILGRSEKLGRPFLYGTTRQFLEHFGLKSLKELPQSADVEPEPQQEQAEPAEEDAQNAGNA
jgi:segregation and condensation protein B